MLATPISCRLAQPAATSIGRLILPAFLLLTSLQFQSASLAQTPATKLTARKALMDASAKFHNNRSDAEAGWQLAKAAFDMAEFIDDSSHRDEIAQIGIAASRRAIDVNPDSAPAYYYLALNLGQVARARKLRALRILPEMEKALLKAANLDSRFDWSGPDRSLGLLYLDAPGWPTSIGNRTKARKHLSAAVQTSPGFPENHICLMEAHAKWNEPKHLEAGLQTLIELLPEARAMFSGAEWAANWADWHDRMAKLESALDKLNTQSAHSPAERGIRH
jgi:tetratricopeptide (TPR) repeat protein